MPDPVQTEGEKLLEFLNNPLNRIVARLFTNTNPDALDGHPLADLTEANFPGYAGVRVVDWLISEGSVNDLAEAVSPAVEWRAGEIVTPIMVTMIGLTRSYDGSDAELFSLYTLDLPLLFSKPGHSLERIFRVVSAAGL